MLETLSIPLRFLGMEVLGTLGGSGGTPSKSITIPGGAIAGMRFVELQTAMAGDPEVLCYMKIMDNYGGVHEAGTPSTDPVHIWPEAHGNPKYLLIDVNVGTYVDAIRFSQLIG